MDKQQEGRAPERGVFLAPYLEDGAPVLLAVDSLGVKRKELPVRDGASLEQAAKQLYKLLDDVDPVARVL